MWKVELIYRLHSVRINSLCYILHTYSIGYKEWVRFAAFPSLWSTEDQDEEYTEKMFEESIVINTLGAALLALMFTVPILLLYPKFRYRPQRIITVTTHHKGTHDRYA